MDMFKRLDKTITYNVRHITTQEGHQTRPQATMLTRVTNRLVAVLKPYRKQNAKASIYFRPDHTNGHKYILLDMDNNPSQQDLSKVKEFNAFIIVQT